MPEKDFPSGPWTGFYQYATGQRGQQDLVLNFAHGRMTGTGVDELGQFLIEGSYNTETREAKWLKSYPAAHSIEYRGFREGPVTGIWGTWHISADWHGGFHIWPVGAANSENDEEIAEAKPASASRRVLAL